MVSSNSCNQHFERLFAASSITSIKNHPISLQITDVDSSILFPFSSTQISDVNGKKYTKSKLASGSVNEAHEIRKRSDTSSDLRQKDLKIQSLEVELEKAYKRINSIYEQIDKREEEFAKRQEDYEEKIVKLQARDNVTEELHLLKLQICQERLSESQLKVSKLEEELQKMTFEKKNCEESSTGSSNKSEELERTLNKCRQDLETTTAKLNTANEKVSNLEATNQQISAKNSELENLSSKQTELDKYNAFFKDTKTLKNCPTLATSKIA
jgi:DNA repair exonuclease SbcCD ATPase subunit